MNLIILLIIVSLFIAVCSIDYSKESNAWNKVGEGLGSFGTSCFVGFWLCLLLSIFIANSYTETLVDTKITQIVRLEGEKNHATISSGVISLFHLTKNGTDKLVQPIAKVKMIGLKYKENPHVVIKHYDSSGCDWSFITSTRVVYEVHIDLSQIVLISDSEIGQQIIER